MPRKNVLTPFKFVDAADMTSVVTSIPVNIQYLDNIPVQFIWSGAAPLGVIKMQGSLTYGLSDKTVTPVWSDIAFTIASPQGSDGDTMIDLNQLSFPWVRFVYTPDGTLPGTGALDGWIGGKALA